MKQLKLSVEKRSEVGRQYVRKLRANGRIPAVIYGKSGTQSLSLDEKEFRMLLRQKGQSASLVAIEIAGEQSILSTIADMQRDPMVDKFMHVDFHEVSSTERMTTAVPIDYVGEAIGVKDFGGVLEVAKHELAVRCLPADLPGSIKIDISGLKINDILHIKDLEKISSVEFVDGDDIVVISCKEVAVESKSETANAGQIAAEEQQPADKAKASAVSSDKA